jgi:hypothetical protein
VILNPFNSIHVSSYPAWLISTSTLHIQLRDYQVAIAYAIGFDDPSLFRGFFDHENRTCMALHFNKHPSTAFSASHDRFLGIGCFSLILSTHSIAFKALINPKAFMSFIAIKPNKFRVG